MNHRLSDELHQRNSCAIVINERIVADVMARASRVFFEMYTRQLHSRDTAMRNQRIDVLTDLVALWNIWIEIILAVPLSEVGECCANRAPNTQDMLNGLCIDNRERTWLRSTDRANIMVRFCFVRIILAGAEHLRCRL